MISAVSVTGPDQLHSELKEKNMEKDILMSQVVPMLTSSRPVVQGAKKHSGMILVSPLLRDIS